MSTTTADHHQHEHERAPAWDEVQIEAAVEDVLDRLLHSGTEVLGDPEEDEGGVSPLDVAQRVLTHLKENTR